MTRFAIIDHGAGNLVSVVNALATLGEQTCVVTEPGQLENTDAIVLPGVGATRSAMKQLTATGMHEAIRQWDRPLLGICVGLQLLFDTSDEDGQACLGLIPGTVEVLSARPLPHMGWNNVNHTRDPLFSGIPDGEPFYFVHSYAPIPKDRSQIIATANHGGPFVAAARSGQRVGVQFHPERSGAAGLRLLGNFTESIGRARHVA